MNNTEFKIKSISDHLGRIEIQIRNLNHQNLYDVNILSENFFCGLLNLVFDSKLENSNRASANFPFIDLIDEKNRIAVQVTSNKSKAKIQKTLSGFDKNNLYEKYDRLIVFVLGEKQKWYTKLIIPDNVSFNISRDIVDFKTLLRVISFLPLSKIDRINRFLESEISGPEPRRESKGHVVKFKKNQTIRKKIERNLLRSFSDYELYKNAELLRFDPSSKFRYDRLNIRSIEDRSYPEPTANDQGFYNWIRAELWNFYPNGLEFVFGTSKQVVIEKSGEWYFVEEDCSEERKNNCWLFSRVPYDYMVEYDSETDDFNGYPTLFVEYQNNGSPFEKEVYGLIGYYDRKHPEKSRMTYYLDERMRKVK